MVVKAPKLIQAAYRVDAGRFLAFSYEIVPPVVKPIGKSGEPVFSNDRLQSATQMASVEFDRLIFHRRHLKYPQPKLWPAKPGATASGLFQQVWKRAFGYHDVRTLDDVRTYFDISSIGPLPLAVDRAAFRHFIRAEGGPAPVLAVGAGHRYVEAGLDAMFGDAITIHESSPKYVTIGDEYEDPVDVEYPPAVIEKADIPNNYFELAYSVFGSFYSRDQKAVLQRVVDGLKVGGEAFLMWKAYSHNFITHSLAQIVNKAPVVFRDGGLDIAVQGIDAGSRIGMGVPSYLVWARKRREEVDVRALFDAAAKPDPDPAPVQVRMSMDGPYFSGLLNDRTSVTRVVKMMIRRFAEDLGADIATLHHKLIGKEHGGTEADACRSLAQAIVGDERFRMVSRGAPITIAVMDYLDEVYSVLDRDTTVPEATFNRMLLEANYMYGTK